jgi:hypothetical protein
MGEPETVGQFTGIYQEIAESHSNPRHRSKSRARRNGLRLLFFGIASLWGFMLGVAVLLCCMKQGGGAAATGLKLYGMLLGAGLVAVAGGLVAAMIYKDAVKRSLR